MSRVCGAGTHRVLPDGARLIAGFLRLAADAHGDRQVAGGSEAQDADGVFQGRDLLVAAVERRVRELEQPGGEEGVHGDGPGQVLHLCHWFARDLVDPRCGGVEESQLFGA